MAWMEFWSDLGYQIGGQRLDFGVLGSVSAPFWLSFKRPQAPEHAAVCSQPQGRSGRILAGILGAKAKREP